MDGDISGCDDSRSWVVSRRWKLDIDCDINDIVPESLKNFSVHVYWVLNLVTPDKKTTYSKWIIYIVRAENLCDHMDPIVTRNYYGDNPIYGIDTWRLID